MLLAVKHAGFEGGTLDVALDDKSGLEPGVRSFLQDEAAADYLLTLQHASDGQERHVPCFENSALRPGEICNTPCCYGLIFKARLPTRCLHVSSCMLYRCEQTPRLQLRVDLI